MLVDLSIVVPTIHGWPSVRETLASVVAAAEPVSAEVIVADGSGLPPPPTAPAPAITWLSRPGRSVYRLREEAMRLARGDIVAVTEDHCHVARDWGTAVIRAHREHPDAAVIGGSIDNGATERLIDWATFFAVQTPLMPPVEDGATDRPVLQGNASYKRGALASVLGRSGLGFADIIEQRELMRRGERVRIDGRLRAWHDQPLGFFAATRMHFDAGRISSSFRRERMTHADLVRIAGAFVIPPVRAARIARLVLRKATHRSELAMSLPFVLWLLYCEALGQLVGYAAGAGDSQARVSG